MKFFYGLAVVLFFLDGLIIQCNATEIDQQILPDELIGEILAKAGLQETREVALAQMKIGGDAIRRIFETRKIVFRQNMAGNEPPITEVADGHDIYLIIRSYTKLISLFEQFGSHARSIHISYESMNNGQRREISEKIIKRYAKRLTELKILTRDDTGIWEDISNDQGDVQFPNVKTFIWIGLMTRKKFDLNAIFPRLNSLTLLGSVADANCLANVRNLKELNLRIRSIQEHQLGNIFRNNQQISKLALTTDIGNTIGRETLRSIENLKNLKTLKIYKVSPDFFNRRSDRVYKLTSVTSFDARFDELIKPNGNFSFDMPNLKHLQLYGAHIDNCICHLINHFKTLETLRLNGENVYNVFDCIKQLKYVKEFTTDYFVKSQFSSLEQFFENFDLTNSSLNELKFVLYVPSEYTFYEEAMHTINNKLRKSNKPTWKLSRIMLDSRNYMNFKRSYTFSYNS